MTDPTPPDHLAAVAAQAALFDLKPEMSEAHIYAELAGQLIAAQGAAAAAGAVAPDGWLSLVRGRLLAVAASTLGLWTAGGVLWAQWQHVRAEGLTPEHAAALAAQAGTLLDSGTALALALTSAVSLVAAGVSWLRAWRRARAAGATV